MNGTKIYQKQIWGSINYQITSYFVPTLIMAGMVQFKWHPSSSFNSRFRVYYEVKQSSSWWKVGWVQSERMLDAVTTNDPAEHLERLPSAPVTVLSYA